MSANESIDVSYEPQCRNTLPHTFCQFESSMMFGLVTLQVEFLGCKSRVPEEVLRRGSTAIEAHRDEDVRQMEPAQKQTCHTP
jgi:hypothetical protein